MSDIPLLNDPNAPSRAELEADRDDLAARVRVLEEALEDVRPLLPVLERHLAFMAAPPGISDEQAAAVLETTAYKTARARLDRISAALSAAVAAPVEGE